MYIKKYKKISETPSYMGRWLKMQLKEKKYYTDSIILSFIPLFHWEGGGFLAISIVAFWIECDSDD